MKISQTRTVGLLAADALCQRWLRGPGQADGATPGLFRRGEPAPLEATVNPEPPFLPAAA